MFFKISLNEKDSKKEATEIIKKAKEKAKEILNEARKKAGEIVEKKSKKANKIAQRQADKVKELKEEIKRQKKGLEISEKKIEQLKNQLQLLAEKNSEITGLKFDLKREIQLRKEIEKKRDKLNEEFLKETQIILAHLKNKRTDLEALKRDWIAFLHGDFSVKIAREDGMERKINSMIEEIEELKKKICKPSG